MQNPGGTRGSFIVPIEIENLPLRKKMPDRIDANLQFHESLPRAGDGPAGGAVGQYRGQQVTQKTDIMSLIADAAEELTFVASEKVEKKLAKRKIGKKAGMKSSALERAEFYLKRLPDLGRPEKLQQFLEHVKKQGAMSPRRLMEEAGKFFKDISHQYAGLSFAKEMIEQEGGQEELSASLKGALDECLKAHGPEIKAGLNMSEIARDFSEQGLGKVQGLRDFYRDMVLKYEGFNETYRSILERYGESGFIQAKDFLIKAVGADLQSQGPSVSPVELKRVIDDLYQLEALGNLHRDCSALLEKLGKGFGIKSEITPQDLMGRIMALKEEQWITGNSIEGIVQSVGIRDIETRIYFLRELKNLVRDIPLKVYGDTESREKFLDAVQEAMDKAIESEEEALG
jgi:type III secretion protein W